VALGVEGDMQEKISALEAEDDMQKSYPPEFTAHAMSVHEEFHFSTILAAFLRTYLTMVLSCLCLDSWKFLRFVLWHTPFLVGGMLMQSYPA